MSRLHRIGIYGIVFAICTFFAAAALAANVGRFQLPGSLAWERMGPEADKQLHGLAVSVQPATGDKIIVSFAEEPITCEPGELKNTLAALIRGFHEEFADTVDVVLPMEKRAWRAVRAERKEDHITVYFGFTYQDLEVFQVTVVQKDSRTLPPDFKAFFSNIRITSRFMASEAAPMVSRANSLVSRKQYADALKQYARALETDPGYWPAHYFQGLCYRRMKACDKALVSLEKAVAQHAHSPSYVEMARCLDALGRKKDAEKAFDQALAINPENDDALLHRANFYFRQGRNNDALLAYAQCLLVNPCNRSAGYNAAQIFLHTYDDPERARIALDKVLAAYPDYDKGLALDKEVAARMRSKTAGSPVVASKPASPKETPKPAVAVKAAPRDLPQWITRLPDVPRVEPVRIAPKLDFSGLNGTRYAGAVSAAKAAVRELLGPMDAASEKRFDAAWAPMFDYPADECVAYLEALTPLVEKALSLRAALAENLQLYDRLWTESGFAAAYSAEAAETLMRAVARQAALVSSLKTSLADVGDALGKLGDPPDPSALKAKAATRHRRAMATLSRLLGKGAPLEGRYERTGLVTLGYNDDDPKKPFFSRIPVSDDLERQVVKPLRAEKDNLVLFYCFCERDGEEKASLFSFDSEPEEWWVIYAEPMGDGWVSYDYDNEDGEITATFFRPDQEGIAVDTFTVLNGRLTDANRTTYDRIPTGQFVKEYVTGENEKTVAADIRKHKEDLAASHRSYLKGRREFQKYLRGGSLPTLPAPSELYWVLTDVRITKKIDEKTERMKTDSYEEVLTVSSSQTSAASFSVAWENKTTFYEHQFVPADPENDPSRNEHYVAPFDREEDSGSMRRVVGEVRTEKYGADVSWTPAPAIVPDGGSWALNPRGAGNWNLSVNGHFDPDNPLLSVGGISTMMPGSDQFFLWEEEPSPDAEISAFGGIPDDAALMTLSAKGGTVSAERYLQFRSDGVQRDQDEYVIPLVLTCGAGGMKVEYVYALKALDEDEAARIAARSGARLEVADVSRRVDKAAEARNQLARQANEAMQERLDHHKANIAYCRNTIKRLSTDMKSLKERMKSGKASEQDIARYNQMAFMVTCQKSEIVTEKDRMRELTTGTATFSRTPFDDMCRAQVVRKAEMEIRAMDGAARAKRKAELLAGKLGPSQRMKAHKLINDCIKSGGAVDPRAWTRLNTAMQNLYQGEQEQELAKIDEEIAWKDAQLNAVQNIKTGADVGMTLLPMAGGPMAVAVAYQTGCGYVEGGILEGVKRGLTTYSDAADVAVSAYDGWKAGGWWGAVENASWSLLMNKGPEAALGRINMKTRNSFDGGYGPVGGPVKTPSSRGAEAIQAAKFQQELEYGKALGEDFFRDYKKLRTAELKGTATKAELAEMRMVVRQKAAAVGHSMTAKSYLKYGAEPIKGKAYGETMDDILGDAVAAYNWEMRNRGFNEQTLYHCRNASSTGAGMDADLALKEQPDLIPVRGKDGTVTYQRNNWLQKNGKPITLIEYQKEGSEVLQAAFKKVSGGYSAKQSFVDMTTSIHAESYPDLDWLKLPKAGAHSDMGVVTRRLDAFFGKVDPGKLPETLNITSTKAEIMFKEHPELRKLGSMMESCRGTAKDLDTKFIPLVESRIRKLEGAGKGKLSPADTQRLTELKDTLDQLRKCRKCFVDIGQGKIPPYEWNHRFRMVTGGQDTVSVVRRLAKITELAAH